MRMLVGVLLGRPTEQLYRGFLRHAVELENEKCIGQAF